MPLIKSASAEALHENIKTEAKTKPIKQAVAIGLSVQRRARGKRSPSLKDVQKRRRAKTEE